MNSHPGVNEMLAVLDALKSAVQTAVVREEQLDREFRAQSAAVSARL